MRVDFPLARRRLVARTAALALLAAALAACSTTPGPAGPGYYRVQRGDTLYRIAREHGRSVNDLVRWNKLSSSGQIDAGTLLRVSPPAGGSPSPSRARPAAPTSAPAPVRGIALIWPAAGKLAGRFQDKGSRGLTIVNAEGTQVVAAAAGTVGYAGNGLRGYGNLIIVRHAGGFLSIYAHNRKLLVKEGQSVRQGQPIAEMGRSDAAQAGLYFELRHGKTPVDPMRALPPR